jgi:putative ABC transport system permease protein
MHRSKIIRNVQLGVKNLSLHAMRSGLTILGVVLGVGSVIAMLSVGEGASREAQDQIRRLGSTNIILDAVKPAEDSSQSSGGHSFAAIYGLLYDDAQRFSEPKSFPQIVRTVCAKNVRKEGRLGERTMELRIVGTTPNWFDVVQRKLVAGRILNERDESQHSCVCVLTEFGARKLLATEHTIGNTLHLGVPVFEVVGVIQSEKASGAIQTPDQDIDAYIPLSVAREQFGDIDIRRSSGSDSREVVELHQILLQVDSIEHVEAVAAAAERMLQQFHKKADYHMSVPLALLRQAEATQRMWNLVLGSIAGISLLVGGIGIMNIMLASVTERTREIGIRRAIGAKRRQIVGQFLIETVVLSTIGGLIGTGLGFLLPWLITLFSGMPTIVPLYSVVLSLGISVGVGVLFGLYPAVRAARLDPIVALRHE